MSRLSISRTKGIGDLLRPTVDTIIARMDMNMKFLLLSATALTALSLSAFAADLPARTAPAVFVAPAPIFSWTGFYAGATAGYAWSNDRVNPAYSSSSLPVTAFLTGATQTGFLPSQLGSKANGGFTGGLTLGYNLQSGNLVYGLEADVTHLSTKSASVSAVAPGIVQIRPQNGVGPSYSDDTLTSNSATRGSANWLGTARGRAGFALDRAFIYGTGGLAFGNVKSATSVALKAHCASVDCSSPNVDANGVWSGSKSGVKVGWALGGGVEYALTNNVSLKAEYLHYDLGKVSYALSPDAGAVALLPASAVVRAKISGDIARAGVNYRF